MNRFARTFLGAVVAIGATAATFGISAGPAVAASVPVTIAAGELSHAAGQTAVAGRIERAAHRACQARPEERSLAVRAADRACVAAAVARARVELAALGAAPVQLAAR